MRVLFVTAALKPHLYPLVTLAWACRAAGHEVRVAAQPPIADEITRAGLAAVPVGGGYDYMAATVRVFQNPAVSLSQVRRRMALAATGGPDRAAPPSKGGSKLSPDEIRLRETVMYMPHIRTAEAMAEELIPFARRWQPDLVVTDPLPYVSPLVAEILQVPLVRHLWGPDSLRQMAGQGAPVPGDIRQKWPDGLTRLYDRHGVELRADYAALTVDPCPAGMQVPGVPNRVPVRYMPYTGSGIVPDWLTESTGRPRVCVTWGTTATAVADTEGFVVPKILDALDGLDVETVVALSDADRERLGTVPDGVRVVDGLPLDWLLPSCRAIINQAGAGTILTAAYHGVPQVTIPQITDQPLNSVMLAGTGAGLALDTEQIDGGDIKAAASTVLFDDAPRAAARRLREEILAQPTPAEIVGTLERLL